jgi:hypothetical protein
MRDIGISAVAVRLATELEYTVDGLAAYVRAQEEACASLENRVVCVTWVLKRPDQERSIHEAR